jgi:thioesterase domain-containing protein
LFGFSAGGNLAFHVAQRLEQLGRRVSDIVLLDSYRRDRPLVIDDETIDRAIPDLLAIGGEETAVPAAMQQKVAERIRHYYRHHGSLLDSGQVHADLWLIVSEDWKHGGGANHRPEEAARRWAEASTGRCTLIQGEGAHVRMLSERHLPKNAALLEQVLHAIFADR